LARSDWDRCFAALAFLNFSPNVILTSFLSPGWDSLIFCQLCFVNYAASGLADHLLQAALSYAKYATYERKITSKAKYVNAYFV